jgi:thioredoxin 1
MSANIVNLTDDTFDQELSKTTVPVLVDFWAPWCGPCKMIAPILEEIATEKGDAVKIAKINVDENQGLAARFGVRAIPTLLYFKGSEVREQSVGMSNKKDIISKLEALA